MVTFPTEFNMYTNRFEWNISAAMEDIELFAEMVLCHIFLRMIFLIPHYQWLTWLFLHARKMKKTCTHRDRPGSEERIHTQPLDRILSNSIDSSGQILSQYGVNTLKQKFLLKPRRNERSSQPLKKWSIPTTVDDDIALVSNIVNCGSPLISSTSSLIQQYFKLCPVVL